MAAFLTEEVPPRGRVLPVLPGIGRIVADNPGPFTYRGTNTYLVEEADGFMVLDPGPDDDRHVADILAAHCLIWGIGAKFPAPEGALADYLARMRARPAFQRAMAR